MNIAPISFGKKIPIMQCNVRDVWQNKSALMTLSEYDCKDEEDIKEISDKCNFWTFGESVARDMEKKREGYLEGKEQKYPAHFYVMEDKHKNIVGLCETVDVGKDTHIEFLEADKETGYKYIGQTMLAMAGKKALERGSEFFCVPHPLVSALAFYIDKCGFDFIGDDKHSVFALFMDTRKVKEFIEKVQQKTNAPIREIKQ